MFLTPKELEAMTERTRKQDQAEWLRKNRIPFLVGGNGHPRVLRAYIENILSARPEKNRPEPNFAALNG